MFLKIGEFARLGSVTPRTLRHYEDIGLLGPAQVDSLTGYRAYRPEQLAQLNRIVALKDLGLSLAQVAQLLDGVTAEQLHGMLALRWVQLEGEIDAQRAQLARVEARLRQIEREGTMTIDDIVRKDIPATQVVAIGGPVSQITNEDLLPVLNRAEEHFAALGIRELLGGRSDPFVTYYTEEPEGEFHAYLTLAAPDIPDPLPMPAAVMTLPEVEVAAAVRKGRVADVFPQVLVDIHRWADLHGCECYGLHRVVVLRGATSVDDADEQLFECQRPIRSPGT
ncbi:MAG TPA: helix-turn-helix domain-containing protein [Acidimicrobiales bacterium]|nr:helix-turn-helix domain-containing protein [Acidimicrobiales bacterium]